MKRKKRKKRKKRGPWTEFWAEAVLEAQARWDVIELLLRRRQDRRQAG